MKTTIPALTVLLLALMPAACSSSGHSSLSTDATIDTGGSAGDGLATLDRGSVDSGSAALGDSPDAGGTNDGSSAVDEGSLLDGGVTDAAYLADAAYPADAAHVADATYSVDGADAGDATNVADAADLAGDTDLADAAYSAEVAFPTGDCSGFGGSGVPVVVSGPTRPQMGSPLLAFDGTSTMAVWTAFTGAGRDFPSTLWATLHNGSVVAHGDVGIGLDTQKAQLFTLASKFMFFSSALYEFTGAAWSAVSGFSGNLVSVSGPNVVGLTNKLGQGVTATLYNGTTVSPATKISAFNFGAVAPDGAGGFAVVTVDISNSQHPVVHFIIYDGVSWNAETTIATVDVGIYAVDTVSVAHTGSSWCVAWTVGSIPTAWILAGGTWTSTTFTGVSMSDLRVAGNNGSFALGGAALNAWAAVYAGGVWTQSVLGPGGDYVFELLPFNAGYVFVYGRTLVAASVFDGAAWTTTTLTTVQMGGSSPSVALAPSAIAVAFSPGSGTPKTYSSQIVTWSGGAWSAPFALTPTQSVGPAVIATGDDLVALYPEPGTMQSRTRSSGAWATAVALPAAASTGMVKEYAMARALDGRALLAWSQYDVDQLTLFAAEYDGVSWGSPVMIKAGVGGPTVAVKGTTFIVGWDDNDKRQVATWTGTGVSTAVDLGTFFWSVDWKLHLASDGNSFVAAWADGNSPSAIKLWSATSADGTTWSTAQQIEPTAGWAILGLVGGPAGIVEWAQGPTGTVSARVWQGGAWSAATSLAAGGLPGGGLACHAAVGYTTALVACDKTSIDAELFANGTWTDVPLGSGGSLFDLGTDGTDYRLDYPYFPSPLQSAVLHAGAWSSPVSANVLVNPYPTAPQSNFVAGACGRWTLIYDDGSFPLTTTHAIGAAAYPAGAQLVPEQSISYAPMFVSWPGEVDALWSGASPSSRTVPVLYVDLGL